MTDEKRMVCAECGVPMNHHADKLVYADAEGGGGEPGGVVEEAHACPACGKTETRRAGAGEGEA